MESEQPNLEAEIASLERTLLEKREQLERVKKSSRFPETSLTNYEIERYSRQLIVPEIGVDGQVLIRNTKYLIVGAGGLGCPVLVYLVGAGAVNVGIIDYDIVDLNNLPRQILHREVFLGKSKAKSAKDYAESVNSKANIQTFEVQIDDTNAIDLLKDFDIVIDCTDNVATRYLLNDACVLLKKPLVSGSALQMEGQLTIYNYADGPCYRCIFPTPPPPETVSNCSEGGILGAITGTIGSLQALEALKIAGKFGEPLSGKLLLFDGLTSNFRSIKLRPKRKDCGICSDHPTITKLINYEQFCGMKANDKDSGVHLLTENDRISVENYKALTNSHLLVDVRTPMEFRICKLENSVNIPMKKLMNGNDLEAVNKFSEVYCICRRGNDSQLAVDFLKRKFPSIAFKDIKGGLHAWHHRIDKDFPIY